MKYNEIAELLTDLNDRLQNIEMKFNIELKSDNSVLWIRAMREALEIKEEEQ